MRCHRIALAVDAQHLSQKDAVSLCVLSADLAIGKGKRLGLWIHHDAGGGAECQQQGNTNQRNRCFFVIHHVFDPFFYSDLTKCNGAGENGSAVGTAVQERVGIFTPLLSPQAVDGSLIASRLDVTAKQTIRQPQQGLKPVDG